jgi:hypothetical protein
VSTAPIAQHARTPGDVERWAELSLRESRERRQERHRNVFLVVAGSVAAAVAWVVMVYYAAGV